MPLTSSIETNGRRYGAPEKCAVVICLDGCEPAYLDAAIVRGLMPNLERMRAARAQRATAGRRTAGSVPPPRTTANGANTPRGTPATPRR